MEEAKKPGPKETRLRIDPEKFAAAMDRLATDEKLQAKLDNKPIEALEELGIEIDKETREVLKGKSLIEIMGVTKEEAVAMKLTPSVVLQPVAIQPKAIVLQPVAISKSRVFSLTGTMTLVHTSGPLVMNRPPLVLATSGPGTMIQTSVVGPREKEAKAEKKKEKKSE